MIRPKLPRLRWLRIKQVDGVWQVSSRPTALVPRNGRLVLIIHGYDNEPVEAGRKYDVLYEELAAFLPGSVFEYMWEVYWPGYWPRGLKIEPLALLSYRKQTHDAPHIARALADFLATQAEHVREVIFIAHSLGCRIVLETIARWLEPPGNAITVPGICLMAAAVPTNMLDKGERLRPAAESVGKQYILHSVADKVLRKVLGVGAFSVGERAGQLRDGYPEAVGYEGNPIELWNHGFMNSLRTGLDHGEYYFGRTEKNFLAPNHVAMTIARMFGRSSIWYPPSRDPYLIEWKLPSSQKLPVATLPTNNPGTF